MQSRRAPGLCRTGLVALLVASSPLHAGSAQDGMASAASVVEMFQSRLLATDRREAAAGPARRASAFAPVVEESHDLEFMARMTLGGAWDTASVEERTAFVAAFRRRSILDYATRFRDLRDAEFRTERTAPSRGGRVVVATRLLEPGEAPVRLDYVLQETPAGWRIVNVVAEGVSELALRRTQYARIIQARGPAGLVKEIEEGNARLELR